MAPTLCFFIGSSVRSSRSIVGMRKASVLPLPVTALPSRLALHRFMPGAQNTHLDDDIFMPHEQWDGTGLHWRHALETHARDGVEDPF